MALPTIIMHDRKIILLNGYAIKIGDIDAGCSPPLSVSDETGLQQAVAQNPDATAFGYFEGRGFAGA